MKRYGWLGYYPRGMIMRRIMDTVGMGQFFRLQLIFVIGLLLLSAISILAFGPMSLSRAADAGGSPPDFVAHGGSRNKDNPEVIAKGSVSLEWSSSGDVFAWDRFHIQLSDDPGFVSLLVDDADVDGTSYEFEDFEHGTTYYWKVREHYRSTWTVYSDTFSFTARIPPILSWSGEQGFIGDGVHPETGILGDYFTFRIKYTDPHAGIAPDYVKLYLDDTGPNEQAYDLTPLSGNDNYKLGVIHSESLQLNTAGSYRYYFEASYGSGLGTVRMPSSDGVYMAAPYVNTPPTLGGNISRTYGIEASVFRYNATFTDADGDRADPKHSFVYVDGAPYPMIEENLLDNDTTDGKEYYYELDELPRGVHDYYFEFKDSYGSIVRTSPTFHPIIYEGWPDLKIASSDIAFKNHPDTGRLVITATVHNIGKGSASDIPVSFWFDDPDSKDENYEPLNNIYGNYSYIIPYLAKGRSHVIEWPTYIIYNDTQKEKFYVTVDMDYTGRTDPYNPRALASPRDESIQETVEYSDANTNNKACNIFSFGPDVEVRESEVIPQSAIYGREVTFIVKVRNVGNDDVPFDKDIVVRIRGISPKGDSTSFGHYTIRAGMVAGSVFTAKVDYRFSGQEDSVVGTWAVTVSATVSGQFVELESENNEVTVDVEVIKMQRGANSPSFSPPLASLLFALLSLACIAAWTETGYARRRRR